MLATSGGIACELTFPVRTGIILAWPSSANILCACLICARRWAPGVVEGFAKQGTHLAQADIHESIRELQHYRSRLFAPAYAGS